MTEARTNISDQNEKLGSRFEAQAYEPGFGDYLQLLKPRVMSLVVFTAAVGLIAAPGSMNLVEAFVSILFIAIGAGASGALNMWWDADIDEKMKRTAGRPIPAGKVSRDEALQIGIALSGLSVIMLGLAANLMAAAMLAFTIFFYAVIYTMWLKRSTPQNIVIGGAAGAFPPVIGWVAATGTIGIEPILMFALIFIWTPPHFWALALFVKTDYHKAGVPMLTVTHGRVTTRQHIWAYSLAMAAVSIALALSAAGGPLTLIVTLLLNVLFLRLAHQVVHRTDRASEADGHRSEISLFKLSLAYLFLIFCAVLAESFLAPIGLGGWAWL